MKLKVGNDIIETERIKKLFNRFPEKFKRRVFSDNEINYCEKRGENKYQSYAARFAAKEAIFKAISDGLEDKFSLKWKDIEIINDKTGRPFAKLNNIDFVESIDVSISHVKEYAIATVIVMVS